MPWRVDAMACGRKTTRGMMECLNKDGLCANLLASLFETRACGPGNSNRYFGPPDLCGFTVGLSLGIHTAST